MVSTVYLEPQLHLWTGAGGCADIWVTNAFHRQYVASELKVLSDR